MDFSCCLPAPVLLTKPEVQLEEDVEAVAVVIARMERAGPGRWFNWIVRAVDVLRRGSKGWEWRRESRVKGKDSGGGRGYADIACSSGLSCNGLCRPA
jgi:hypothetical protein